MTWLVTSASILGQSHRYHGQPCQDAYAHRPVKGGWGVVVVCDGAGSYLRSHLGARLVSQQLSQSLHQLIFQQQWWQNNTLPHPDAWTTLAFNRFTAVHHALKQEALNHNCPLMDYSTTAIALIYSPFGLCIAHVGDGRAAYSPNGEHWQALITPTAGELAGSTLFITQTDWILQPELYFEARVINHPVKAFALMTDGCENASFYIRQWDETTNQYQVMNKPFDKFFQTLTQTHQQLWADHQTPDQIQARFVQFLTSGNVDLQKETDDKTLIFGLHVD